VDAIQFVKTYFLALTLFFAFDMAWLGFVAKGFYQRQIGALLKENISWPAAFVFYALFVFGLVHFVITPGMEKRSAVGVLLNGALFGLVTYSAYDLTNLAITKDWPLAVTVVDLAWGAFLGAIVSLLTFKWMAA
jgi:uncharacterized membrane protein